MPSLALPAHALALIFLLPCRPAFSAEPPAPAETVVELPPLKVTADPLPDDDIAAHDRAAREETARAARPGRFARFFNGFSLPLIGGRATADRLAEGARRRGEILDHERLLLLALRDTRDPAERRALRADLADLRRLRREIVAEDPR